MEVENCFETGGGDFLTVRSNDRQSVKEKLLNLATTYQVFFGNFC